MYVNELASYTWICMRGKQTWNKSWERKARRNMVVNPVVEEYIRTSSSVAVDDGNNGRRIRLGLLFLSMRKYTCSALQRTKKLITTPAWFYQKCSRFWCSVYSSNGHTMITIQCYHGGYIQHRDNWVVSSFCQQLLSWRCRLRLIEYYLTFPAPQLPLRTVAATTVEMLHTGWKQTHMTCHACISQRRTKEVRQSRQCDMGKGSVLFHLVNPFRESKG